MIRIFWSSSTRCGRPGRRATGSVNRRSPSKEVARLPPAWTSDKWHSARGTASPTWPRSYIVVYQE